MTQVLVSMDNNCATDRVEGTGSSDLMERVHPLEKFRFCPVCGSEHFEVNSEKSKRCGHCGFEYFFNPSASTVAVICNQKNELLVVGQGTRQGHAGPAGRIHRPVRNCRGRCSTGSARGDGSGSMRGPLPLHPPQYLPLQRSGHSHDGSVFPVQGHRREHPRHGRCRTGYMASMGTSSSRRFRPCLNQKRHFKAHEGRRHSYAVICQVMNLLLLHADEVQFYTWDDMFMVGSINSHRQHTINNHFDGGNL